MPLFGAGVAFDGSPWVTAAGSVGLGERVARVIGLAGGARRATALAAHPPVHTTPPPAPPTPPPPPPPHTHKHTSSVVSTLAIAVVGGMTIARKVASGVR